MNGRTDGRTDERTDGRTDERTDGRTDARTYVLNSTERPGRPHDCLLTEEFSRITDKLLMYLPSFSSLNILNVNVFAITKKRLNLEIQFLSYTSTVKQIEPRLLTFPQIIQFFDGHVIKETLWEFDCFLPRTPTELERRELERRVTESFSEHHRQYADDARLYIFAGKEEWISGVHTIEQCTRERIIQLAAAHRSRAQSF